MALELVTPLPPGAPSHTRLAKHGVRLVVLREIRDGTDCSWPVPSPKMVTLLDVVELQGKRHALFPWVPGVTLRELVKGLEFVGQPVPLGLVGRVLVDAARALAGITPPRAHGGVQDGAMQVGFDGQVCVLDFGAPRISRFRPIGRVNFAADVFALGGVLHTVLTGFKGDYASPPATLASLSTSHPEATPAIDEVVQRALSLQPDSRQADAQTFADELEAVLGDELFSAEKLAEVVTALFKDRVKLLQSLGGWEQPPAGIPLGTQPGRGGFSEPLGSGSTERTDVGISIPADVQALSGSMAPWASGEDVKSVTTPGTREPSTPRPLGADGEQATTRAGGPRALSRSDVDPETVVIDLSKDTHSRPSQTQGEATGPRPGLQPRPRNTTEAERHRALGQELLRTPPQGISPADTGDDDGEEELREEPTGVRPRPDPKRTAQTAQMLTPQSSSAGLRIVMVALLIIVLAITVAVLVKFKRQSEKPLPLDERLLVEVDAGEPAPPTPDVRLAITPELEPDGGEEDEVEADAGAHADAGAESPEVDAGVPDAGAKMAKKPVKKKRPVRKKRRRR